MKERMITRTITEYTYTLVCITLSDNKVYDRDYTSGTEMSGEKAVKHFRKLMETDDFKVVAFKGVKSSEKLYGMTEDEFIAAAKVLPPRK